MTRVGGSLHIHGVGRGFGFILRTGVSVAWQVTGMAFEKTEEYVNTRNFIWIETYNLAIEILEA